LLINVFYSVGKYVCAESNQSVVANRDAVGPWEEFSLEQSGSNIALRTAHGFLLCAEPSGLVIGNRTAVGPWEQFSICLAAGQTVAFRHAHGKLLCAESLKTTVERTLSVLLTASTCVLKPTKLLLLTEMLLVHGNNSKLNCMVMVPLLWRLPTDSTCVSNHLVSWLLTDPLLVHGKSSSSTHTFSKCAPISTCNKASCLYNYLHLYHLHPETRTLPKFFECIPFHCNHYSYLFSISLNFYWTMLLQLTKGMVSIRPLSIERSC